MARSSACRPTLRQTVARAPRVTGVAHNLGECAEVMHGLAQGRVTVSVTGLAH